MVSTHRGEENVLCHDIFVSLLETDPSKKNIVDTALAYAKTKAIINREEALALIDALHLAEAKNSRGVGRIIEDLISVAEENIRRRMRATA